MKTLNDLNAVSDDDLLRRLSRLVEQSRWVDADLVAHIGEVDRRELYAREATSSMFGYCTRVLHLSEYEAYMRIAVARASRKHPVLLAMLRDGRLHLSAIHKLAPHLDVLDDAGRSQLLRSATHRTKRQVEELIAEIAPQADVPTTIRKLPQRPASEAPSQGNQLGPDPVASRSPTNEAPSQGDQLGPDPVASRSPTSEAPSQRDQLGPDPVALRSPSADPTQSVHPVQPVQALQATPPDDSSSRSHVASPAEHATVEPLAPERYKVTFTASADLRDKLDRLQALMPDRDLAALIDIAVTEKLERVEARRFGKTKSPRTGLDDADVSAGSRHVPAAVRRVVHDRDGGRCTFVSADGRRCNEQRHVEFHHDEPFALGGDRSPGNIRMLCRAHNAYLAESTYGKNLVAKCRRTVALDSPACGAPRPALSG